MIRLRFATIEPTEWGCVSRFDRGGAEVPAQTHWHDRHYAVIAHRCGYGDDLRAYTIEHEVCHHLLAEALYGTVSPVLWGLACGVPLPPAYAAQEELAVQALQRFVRAAERPIVGGVDWDALKARVLVALRSV